MNKSVSQRFVDFAAPLKYEALPAEVIAKLKMLMLDTLGVSIGSTRLDFGIEMLEVIQAWGGRPESSLIGSNVRVSAQNAAMFNGILAHGQDYDDTHTESVVHPSAVLVPVALAMAERGHCSGRDMLSALAGGTETAIRVALPALNKFHLRGFHTTAVCAPYGAALIAAKLRGLSADQARHALGITGSFASGVLECVPAAAGSKRLHAGWAGNSGIVAAEFAMGGITGPDAVFEGHLGFYNSFLRNEKLDLEAIFKGIGSDWEILNVSPKLYPCCHYLQTFLDCASNLRSVHDLRWQDIQRIDCRIPQGGVNIVCEPWQRKIAPETGYDTRFSLPFAVAVMLVKGTGGVADFSEEACVDPEIKACIERVHYQVDPDYQVKDMSGAIEVTTFSGATHSWEVPRVRGDSRNPIPEGELLSKFYANTEFLGRSKSERIAEQILNVEQFSDINELMEPMRVC